MGYSQLKSYEKPSPFILYNGVVPASAPQDQDLGRFCLRKIYTNTFYSSSCAECWARSGQGWAYSNSYERRASHLSHSEDIYMHAHMPKLFKESMLNCFSPLYMLCICKAYRATENICQQQVCGFYVHPGRFSLS